MQPNIRISYTIWAVQFISYLVMTFGQELLCFTMYKFHKHLRACCDRSSIRPVGISLDILVASNRGRLPRGLNVRPTLP